MTNREQTRTGPGVLAIPVQSSVPCQIDHQEFTRNPCNILVTSRDSAGIPCNVLLERVAKCKELQQMEQLSQGISVCSEGEFTSIIQPSVSLEQYLEDYEAFEGPVTDHEWSDDDEQRVFYSTLGDVSTSDNGQTLLYSASCEAAAGVSPALQRVDEELTPLDSPHVTPAVQRVDEGQTLLDALHVSPPVQRVDEEPMPLYAALSDMSISDGDSQPPTAHALLAPLVQRMKAEKEAAFKKARMNKKRALRKKRREQDRAKEGTDMKRKTKKRRTEARKDAFKMHRAPSPPG
ncbi:hypothetical protein JOM56_014679 [Amanita muscaria]